MLALRTQCLMALAHPIRLKILELLRNSDLCACDLQLEINVSRSQLQDHLNLLEAAQLVSGLQDGDWRYYSIQPEPLRQLRDYLDLLGDPLFLPAQHCGSSEEVSRDDTPPSCPVREPVEPAVQHQPRPETAHTSPITQKPAHTEPVSVNY